MLASAAQIVDALNRTKSNRLNNMRFASKAEHTLYCAQAIGRDACIQAR
jgi:hypothetical protein